VPRHNVLEQSRGEVAGRLPRDLLPERGHEAEPGVFHIRRSRSYGRPHGTHGVVGPRRGKIRKRLPEGLLGRLALFVETFANRLERAFSQAVQSDAGGVVGKSRTQSREYITQPAQVARVLEFAGSEEGQGDAVRGRLRKPGRQSDNGVVQVIGM